MNQQQLGYPIVGNGRTGYSNPSYGNNNLIMNTPYDNYMGGFNNQTNLQQQQLSPQMVRQFLKLILLLKKMKITTHI